MTADQQSYLQKINGEQIQVGNYWLDYWNHFSNIGTWQFWFHVLMLVVPLVALYFLIDRKKALRIGFFGFNVHVWFGYIDAFGASHGLWSYPYKAIPFLPLSFGLDAAFVPVTFMLVYQWIINHNKNYYLYMTGLCIVFGFVIKPILHSLDLFQMYGWMNYFYLFLGYVVIMLLSKWITTIFVKFETDK